MVAGGGVALVRALDAVSSVEGDNEDQNVGISIATRAMSWPLRQIAINAGVDGCAFGTPAPVGARVRLGSKLARARSVPGGGVRLTFAVEFEVEGAEDPACTAQVHYLYFA